MHYGIIAAGEGSRLAQEGVALPKPLVRLCGQPMIERLIRIFGTTGAESVSVIVNEEMTEVLEFLASLAGSLPFPLQMIVKSTPSSMHSFHELSRLMRGRGKFILTTVDTIFRPQDFRAYATRFAGAGPDTDGVMAVTRWVDDEKPLWVDADPSGRITAFLDTAPTDARFISGGIYGLTEPAIDVLDECVSRGGSRMRNYQRALVDAGLRLEAFDMGKILDVDHASDIAKAEEYLNAANTDKP